MIQRSQSIYLLLVVVISGLLLNVPVYELHDFAAAGSIAKVTTFNIMDNTLLVILNSAIGVLAFITIFLYKWRNVQIRICNINLLLTCLLIALLFFVADTMSSNMNQRVQYRYGSYLPLIELVLLFIASRAVKKDDELVKSADRLR
ncbi:MAG: DUF4293 family protein [Bacteroidetes bacterium]|nr:MAG: DUF4293 family protein [Bacteroidota bacterium]